MTLSINREESGAPLGSAAIRLGVPWLTVVPFAAAFAYVDGFWVTSLRGAVGAIERTQSPFAGWLRESTAVLPLFVAAVLVAAMVAQSRFGPQPRTTRTIAATGLLVAVTATVAGIVVLAASSAYDYQLQSAQAHVMGSMGRSCGAACVASQNHAALMLQVTSVGYGSLILLATNVVVVGWLAALRGGRLTLGVTRGPSRTSRVDDLRLGLAVALVGTAAIHAAVVAGHLTERPVVAVALLGLTAAELGVAVRLLSGPTAGAQLAAAAISVLALALGAWSRSLGMPRGTEAGVPESVPLADVMAGTLEIATLLVALALLRGGDWVRQPTGSAHVSRLALVAVLAVTVFGLAGSGLPSLDVFGVTAHRAGVVVSRH